MFIYKSLFVLEKLLFILITNFLKELYSNFLIQQLFFFFFWNSSINVDV